MLIRSIKIESHHEDCYYDISLLVSSCLKYYRIILVNKISITTKQTDIC